MSGDTGPGITRETDPMSGSHHWASLVSYWPNAGPCSHVAFSLGGVGVGRAYVLFVHV